MTDYIDSTALSTYVGAPLGTVNAGNAPLAITAASRAVESYTGREFTNDTAATLRKFHVHSESVAFVDDFWETASLIVALDEDDTGAAETTLTTADYELYPLNGRIIGIGTVPYSQIRLINRCFYTYDNRYYPGDTRYGQRPTLHVTAKWGWTAIPDVIKRATAIIAAEMLKDPETPFGIIGFGGEMATPALARIRANPRVMQALDPFVKTGPRVS